MKKSILIFMALPLIILWSCKVDVTVQEPFIALTAPEDGASVDLTSAGATPVQWNAIAGISQYTLVMSASGDMSEPQSIAMNANPYQLSAADLDSKAALLGIAENSTGTIYWTVRPTNPAILSKNEIRSLGVTRGQAVQSVISLDMPADGSLMDLNDPQSDPVVFSWHKIVAVSGYNIVFSLSENLSDPVVEQMGSLGSLRFAGTANFDDLLAELGIGVGATGQLYWSVVPDDGDTSVVTEVRSLTVVRTASDFISPENGKLVQLKYSWPGGEAPAPVTFQWREAAAADTYELVFSRSSSMSSPVIVPGIDATSKQFTHAELQQLLIEPDGFGLRRYLPNKLYWNVRVGDTYISADPGYFDLNGMMVFTDSRDGGQEVNVYRVTHISHGGYEGTWMADDLRTSFSSDGQDLTTLNVPGDGAYPQFAGPARATEGGPAGGGRTIPAYFLETGTMYYRCTTDTPAYLSTGDWKLPTLQEWRGLFDAALTVDTYATVLKDPNRFAPNDDNTPTYSFEGKPDPAGWNAWKMNMGPNGRFYYSYNAYAYFHYDSEDFGGGNGGAYEMFYAYDYAGDDTLSGKYFFYWESGNPPYSAEGASGWWGTGNSMVPARLKYTGR